MRFLNRPKGFYFVVFAVALALSMSLSVACGAAATATPSAPPAATTMPAPNTGAVSTPTAAPNATAAPPAPVVTQGKLTWLFGGWGNERFSYNYATGAGVVYGRVLHAEMLVSNEKAQLLPGVATKWEISSDGKTWTFTIRDGVKFHDGKTLTAEDVWWSWMHFWGKDESGEAKARATNGGAQTQAAIVDKIQQPALGKVSITTTSINGGFPAALMSELAPAFYGVVPKRPKVHDDAQEAA